MPKPLCCTTLFAPVLATVFVTLGPSSCATNPDGKKIFTVIDGKQLSAMGLSAFDEMKSKGKISRDARALWQNMMALSNGAPPQWLSTHPNSEKRMERLVCKF